MGERIPVPRMRFCLEVTHRSFFGKKHLIRINLKSALPSMDMTSLPIGREQDKSTNEIMIISYVTKHHSMKKENVKGAFPSFRDTYRHWLCCGGAETILFICVFLFYK